jgi:hypothetical protein
MLFAHAADAEESATISVFFFAMIATFAAELLSPALSAADAASRH